MPSEYARLPADAELVLRHRLLDHIAAGRDVVVDFSFHTRARREDDRGLVHGAGGRSELVSLRAHPALLRATHRPRPARRPQRRVPDHQGDARNQDFEPTDDDEPPTVIEVAQETG